MTGPALAEPVGTPALRVDDLTVRTAGGRTLVSGVSLQVAAGERVGLIGESGSGKSLTALSVLGLLPDNLVATGRVDVAGEHDLLARSDRRLAPLRGSLVSMVFQEPMTALNPLLRVGRQVAEVITLHPSTLHTSRRRGDARARAVELLGEVGLPDPAAAARAYPHQLSGGQRQRVMIAMALANDPALLVADEPTTALDVTVQAQVLELMGRLVARRGTGLLFITHDLAVVSQVCERVVVMKDGAVVEQGPVAEVFANPRHDYTRTLLAASILPPRPAVVEPRPPVVEPVETTSTTGRPAIRLRDVTKRFHRSGGVVVDALRGISFEVAPGERFGLVGESGSGKTTTLRLLAALDTPTSGTVEVAGVTLAALPPTSVPEDRPRGSGTRPTGTFGGRARARDVARVRSDLQLVFQDPMGSLDPRMAVADIVAEPLLNPANRRELPEAATRAGRERLVRDVLAAVGLPDDAAARYPHQFSGGQRQRISIARALVCRPKVLVADEPVSALDVSVRAQVLDLLARLADERDLTLVLVSHDLAVVRHLCDRVAVMRAGEIVEQGPADRIWTEPQHEYTRTLQAATPVLTTTPR
ncbi:ABC transporter related protein [Xylanimonas cellulosilytica DSM 15894]|uniref:ABC transporter related protein n=1 Tax=Xylanimonas cellulosilytica (strain DSM 15894 / JCM 12276 / CECT 5975 / KCTC 9989 / LMG 20990 / NBRC 107835 / XIL07) TaxID=446471 RepID=D1C0E7_XYLCX|nr:ABC transporter ATP-binding protein [Xylanimonas cellulosilytica]ACZ32150.1 ABC transporter related protein [Xylanimonas cellulosilytica DSM 15894]